MLRRAAPVMQAAQVIVRATDRVVLSLDHPTRTRRQIELESRDLSGSSRRKRSDESEEYDVLLSDELA